MGGTRGKPTQDETMFKKFVVFCSRTHKINNKNMHANYLYQKLTCQLKSTKKIIFTIHYLQFCKPYFKKQS